MKSVITTILLVIINLVVSERSVFAQLTTLPVSFSPKEIPDLKTVVVYGDFGFFNHNVGDFKSVVGRLNWNPARFSILVGGGALLSEKDQSDNGFTVGTALGYDVRPGSEQPWKAIIQFKGGLGYAEIGELKQWNFPLALGVALYLPPPKVNGILWGSPRFQVRVSDKPDGTNSTELGFGVSAGLAITSIRGPGIHLDGEWLLINGQSEIAVAVGLHWDFPIL